eukprot:1149439-Pelagomonas_calceolata.AAC.7
MSREIRALGSTAPATTPEASCPSGLCRNPRGLLPLRPVPQPQRLPAPQACATTPEASCPSGL